MCSGCLTEAVLGSRGRRGVWKSELGTTLFLLLHTSCKRPSGGLSWAPMSSRGTTLHLLKDYLRGPSLTAGDTFCSPSPSSLSFPIYNIPRSDMRDPSFQ